MKKNILITGVTGFIGFNTAYELSNKYNIFGVDNFDNYYPQKIKYERLKILKKKKNFNFQKIDIVNFNKLNKFITSNNIEIIIHLAAQAGVRYSYVNPEKYINSNIFGFLNIVWSANINKIKKIIYASSSSVYGDNKNFPLNEKNILKPKNIYAVSKKINEETAELYQNLTKIKFIGLRFFTIFGEWGRPDMFLFKLFKAHKLDKILELNNFGNHQRDFTYIKDVTKIINKLIFKKTKKHEIVNLCSNRPKDILKIVNKFKKDKKLKIKLSNLHKADVLKTHGDNGKIKKMLKIKTFSDFEKSFLKTFKWYDKNNFHKF